MKKADSIKVAFRDRYITPDLFEKYPNAEVVVTIHREKDEKFKWDEIRQWNILSRGKLVLCLQSLADAEECKKLNVPFYWGYPVSTYYDLRALKELGVAYIRLDAPLFFEMDEVKKFGIPVRAVPNVAYLGEIPTKNGIYGTWIRPDDVEIYEDYIACLEFEDCDIKKEGGLFNIYSNLKVWGGPLSTIVSNLNSPAENHLISQEGIKIRLNCGQKCQKTGKCHICERLLRLADTEKLTNYIKGVRDNDKEKVIAEIEDILKYDFDRPDVTITKTTTLNDLYISSLELADLILKIEETFDIETPFGNGSFPFGYIDEFIDWLVNKINE